MGVPAGASAGTCIHTHGGGSIDSAHKHVHVCRQDVWCVRGTREWGINGGGIENAMFAEGLFETDERFGDMIEALVRGDIGKRLGGGGARMTRMNMPEDRGRGSLHLL